MKVKAKIGAYVADVFQEEYVSALKEGDPEAIISALSFSKLDMSGLWAPAGVATVEIDILDENAIRNGLADALREKRKTVLAEAQLEANRLTERINSLLAIEYTPPAADVDDGGPL